MDLPSTRIAPRATRIKIQKDKMLYRGITGTFTTTPLGEFIVLIPNPFKKDVTHKISTNTFNRGKAEEVFKLNVDLMISPSASALIYPREYIEKMKVRLLVKQVHEEVYRNFGNQWGMIVRQNQENLYIEYENTDIIVEAKIWQVTHHEFACDCDICWPGK